MRGRLRVCALAVWWWSGTSIAVADRVLDRPAFAASASELLALAKAAPGDDWPVVILRDQHDVSYDERGRATVRWRLVFVVRTRAGIDGWGTLRSEWRPYYQDRPALRARVIEPDGDVTEIDPTLVSDAPVAPVASYGVSDRRRVEAPLPRLQIGAVVEQEIVTIDREPMLSAGTIDTTPIGGQVPTLSTVIAYSAPAARKVHHVERRLPPGVRARHQIANGRESWVYQIGILPARGPAEPDVPADVVVQPYVGVGTAASWAAVAREYRAVLDARIADGPIAWPAEVAQVASIDAVNALAAWMRRRVRYTGIEFGQASNVPWPPAQTVKRGFGDCKDMALVLVALLRQAGIRADVALLDAGPGMDVDPDLPGMGAFDHAIVRARVDGRDVWIDAVEPLMRPGQLPPRDQGRRVLVIADDTRGLASTPAAAPGENTVREVRTFVAAESGRSQLTEVTRATGVFERDLRGWFLLTRSHEVRRSYAEYVEGAHGGTLDTMSWTRAEDLGLPFELTVAAKDVRVVYADPWQLDIRLRPSPVLERVPPTVTEGAGAARTEDFAWPFPQVYEIENRIVMPHGFAPPSPSDRVRSLGPATLTERRQVDGQTLIVTFRFDSGKPRLKPGELAVLQDALRSVRDEEVHITVEHAAFALAREGKPREAIAECERLIALHPREAAHHVQRARVLLGAGAGEAARRAAREAVALAPAEPETQVALGWMLSHDTHGRLYTYDWDRAGAIAAYQKARTLDPAHRGMLNGLTEALLRDPFGRPLEAGSDPGAAIEVMRAGYAIWKSDELAMRLATLLTWTGRFAEGEQLARTTKQGESRDRLIVAAAAGAGGGTAAIRVAGELSPGVERTRLLEQAAWWALYLQRYDAAREMFAESGKPPQPAAFAGAIDKLTARPAIRSGTGDPRSAALDVLVALADRHRKTPVFWDEALERSARRQLAHLAPPQVPGGGQLRYLEDLAQSATIQLDGDAGLWRAAVDLIGQRAQLYFALDRGIVKLIGAPEAPTAIGRYVLGSAGDAKGESRARRLLDWLRADLEQASAERAVAFRKLWGPGLPTSRDAILLAAAWLAGSTDADRAMAVASRCPLALPGAKLACHEILLAVSSEQQRWPEALSQIDAIAQLSPDRAASLAQRRSWLLASTGRLDAADKLLDDVLARDPANRDALVARMRAAEAAGQVQQALQRADAVVNHPDVPPVELNNVAWMRLGAHDDLPAALELARKAAHAEPRSAAILNTLAALEAETGDVDRAVRDNWKAMDLAGSIEPEPSDWYVVGRIHEQLGLDLDARKLYKRIARTRSTGVTAYSLAQHRLDAMFRPR